MSPLSDSGSPFTAFVGIDWADTKHDVCVQAANSDQREFASFPHQTNRIEECGIGDAPSFRRHDRHCA